MPQEVGTAYVTIMPSMKGFSAEINKTLAGAGKQGGNAFGKGFSDASGKFSSKMAAMSGAVGGFAASIGGQLLSSLANLSGEIQETADSAQKFASTLSFAGLDTSTIDALTESTKEYAAKTVYSLSDVRNVTAQLAANGVKDYDKLAEAAGNLNAVAGGTSETYKSVGMVLTQTAGQGKLTTENWNQLADAIPGASGKLQEAMKLNGAYTGNFRDAMEKGEITAGEFNQALLDLGLTDVASQAAESTTTLEGSFGNFQATFVDGMSEMLQTATPAITTITNFLNEQLSVAFEVANTAVGAFADAINSGATPLESLSAAFSTLPSNVQQSAVAIGILGGAFVTAKLVSTASSVANSFRSLASGMSSIAGKAASAASGLITTGTASKVAGSASAVSAKQIMASAIAVVSLGAGVALAAAGLSLLVYSSIQLASAGPLATVAMVGMVAAIAGLAVGAAALGPALTAGSVGFVAFGGAIALVGTGILLASAGITLLATTLPVVAMYGTQAALGFSSLALSLALLSPAMLLVSVGVAAFAAAAALGAVGITALGVAVGIVAIAVAAFAVSAAAAGVALSAVSASGLASAIALLSISAGAIASVAGLTLISATGLLASVGLLTFSASATAASIVLPVLSAAMGLAGAAVSLFAGGVGLLSAGMAALAAAIAGAAAGCATMASALPIIASSAPGAAGGLTALAGASVAAAGGLGAAIPGLAGLAASSAGAAAGALTASVAVAALTASLLVATAALLSTQASTLLMKAAMSSMSSSVKSNSSVALNSIKSMAKEMQSTINNMKLKIPKIEVEALPHFKMTGKFDAQAGTVPSINVEWYGSGGFFNRASLIGVGEAGPEVNMPLAGRKMRPFAEAVAGNMESGQSSSDSAQEIIAWLAANLPAIIERYTPVMGESDFNRRARKAVKYV